MRSLYPSAAALQRNYALVSQMRMLGFEIGITNGGKPMPGDMFLVTDGETPPAPARTLVIDQGVGHVMPSKSGNPARIAFDADNRTIGQAFAQSLLRGPDAPTAGDPESLALFALADRVAASDITVLINGPTGTGKEVLARHIHSNSARASGPFVAVNCAALPEAMLEALLFGHTKGAFTGAGQAAQGFFRAANGGTLLLDEIAEMPLNLQAKLLRTLQEREVVPLGASTPEAIDVRVVACANRDLQDEVAAGRFRADLYYRLSVFPLSTKALVDRPADIPPLIATMILRHSANRASVPFPTPEVVAALVDHDWPGNVRELENVVQRALLLAPADAITMDHIIFDAPRKSRAAVEEPVDPTLTNIVKMSEFQAIRETLAACNGSRVETAKRLGVSERTLRYRLAKMREEGDLARTGVA